MTLIQAMAFRNQFAMVTSDTRVMYIPYGPKPKDFSLNDAEVADFLDDKVDRLTEKVLLATSGQSFGADFIREELGKRVQPDNDLGECAAIFRLVLEDAAAGLLEDADATAIDFVLNGSTNCDFIGFYHNGKSGLATFQGESYQREFIDVEAPMEKGFPAQMHSPDPDEDRDNFLGYINLPEAEQRMEKFIELFIDLHAYFSSIHNAVSSDCNFHFLWSEDGVIKYYTKSVETADRYEELGLIK